VLGKNRIASGRKEAFEACAVSFGFIGSVSLI